MDNNVASKVLSFVADFTGHRVGEVNPMSSLGKDLGVDGDDARELIMKFSTLFKVDISNFKFDQYFGPERSATIVSLLRALRGREASLDFLVVADLIRAAQSGVLSSQTIVGRPRIDKDIGSN